jgi:hypothetical protein
MHRLGDSKRIPNVENALFDLFRNDQNKVPINKFFLVSPVLARVAQLLLVI